MAQQAASKTKVGWKIHAYYLDACNCDWGCPCQFNAKPTQGYCDGLITMILSSMDLIWP
jgi:hypothetical protein